MQLTRRQFSGWLSTTSLAALLSNTEALATEQALEDAAASNLTQANNGFAFKLLKQLSSSSPSDNHFLSPFSLESALTIALEGARGQTASQIGTALHIPDSLKRSGDEPWNMSKLRSEYSAMLAGLKPPADEAANKTRKQLAELKQKLDGLNAKSKALSQQKKYPEATQINTEASQVASRINQIAKSVDQFELASANSLWVDRAYPLAKSYQKTIQEFYGSAEANQCDFAHKANDEIARINSWVSQHTRDKIKSILAPGGLSNDTRLVIANAIYFKGNWAKPFLPSFTEPAQFTLGDGTKSNVSMMYQPGHDVARYAAFEGDGALFDTPATIAKDDVASKGYPSDEGFQVVQLPYVGDRLSMVILLPRRPDGLNKLLDSFTEARFSNCLKSLKKRAVNVKLPQFKLETTYNMRPSLNALGMSDAFSPELADFSGLTDSKSLTDRLFISLVIHKAFVEVNEKGTEAAAATVVAMTPTAAVAQRPFTPDFFADRPFITTIIDNSTDTILFVGKVERP